MFSLLKFPHEPLSVLHSVQMLSIVLPCHLTYQVLFMPDVYGSEH